MTRAARCPALLILDDGSVRCWHNRSTRNLHVHQSHGQYRAFSWVDDATGAASAVSLVSRRRLAGLLEVGK